MTDEKKFWELSKEEQDEQIRKDLKEMAHWYGGLPEGWKKIREIIDELENNANEAAYERAYRN